MAHNVAAEGFHMVEDGAGVGFGADNGAGNQDTGGADAANALVVLGTAGEDPPPGGAQPAVDEGGDFPPPGGDGLQPPAGAAAAPTEGGEVPGPGAEPEADPAAQQAGEDESDEDGMSVCSAIVRAAGELGCLVAITDALAAMCEVAGGVQTISAPLLGSQVIILGNQVTTLKLATGVTRVQAVTAFVEKLRNSSVPPTSAKDGLVSSFLAVLEVLYPEPVAVPVSANTRAGGAHPLVTGRDGSPDTGLIQKMCAVMDYRDDRKTSTKECSAMDMAELGRLIAPFVGSASKGSADLASMSQTKTILTEIGKHHRFPSELSCQPDKIVRFGGDHSLAAPKAEKGKELVAEETTDARVLRGRFRTFCLTTGACLLKQPSTPTDSMQDAATAALGMHEALADAEHLVTHKQVETAISNCLQAARLAQNCDDRRRRGFTVACERGAQAIHEANTLARTFQAMGVHAMSAAAAPAAAASGDDKPVTMRQLKQALTNGKTPGKPGKQGKSAGGKANHFKVKLPDGSEKLFERLPGGNNDCPVHCNKAHAKDKWCHFNHSKK